MIKHWRLFEDITKVQIKQLQAAHIFVQVEDESFEISNLLNENMRIVKNYNILISTTSESQEMLLRLMFPKTIKLIGYENDYR